MKEVALGRVAGPFNDIPFESYIQSPIGLVPKDNGTQTRLIFHLSYEFPDDRSVNYYIPDELCSVKYQDLDAAVAMCLCLAGNDATPVHMSKTDGKKHFQSVATQ